MKAPFSTELRKRGIYAQGAWKQKAKKELHETRKKLKKKVRGAEKQDSSEPEKDGP